MTTAQLKKQLSEQIKAKQRELEELIEVKKIEMEVAKINSPRYKDIFIEQSNINKLDAVIEHISDIYRQDNRKVSMVYAYGAIPNKLLTICKAIQYTKAAEKQELLMLTGLTESVVEEVITAFGNTPYYSKRDNTVIEGIPMDIGKTVSLLELIAVDMGLVGTINTNKFTTETVNYQYKTALLKAQESQSNTEKYYTEEVSEYTE